MAVGNYFKRGPGFLPANLSTEKELGVSRVPVGGNAITVNNSSAKSRENFINAVPLAFTANTNQLAILPANIRRVYLLIQNQGGISLRVSFSSPSAGVLILAGGSYELTVNCPNSSLYIWTDTGSCNGVLIEGVK